MSTNPIEEGKATQGMDKEEAFQILKENCKNFLG